MGRELMKRPFILWCVAMALASGVAEGQQPQCSIPPIDFPASAGPIAVTVHGDGSAARDYQP